MVRLGRPVCQFQIAETLQLPMIALTTGVASLANRRPWPNGSSPDAVHYEPCGRWVSL